MVDPSPPTASATRAAAPTRLGHALAEPVRTRILLALREVPAYPSELGVPGR